MKTRENEQIHLLKTLVILMGLVTVMILINATMITLDRYDTGERLDRIEAKLEYMDEQLSVPITLDCPHRKAGE